MEIAKQTDLIEQVAAQYRPYIEALRTPDLKSQKRSDNLNHIYKSIVLAMELVGSKNAENQDSIKFISEKFLEEISVKYPFARHGEISLAFKKGALKEYGEYFGFNVQTCWIWFKKYMESPELLAAKRQWIDIIELPKKVPLLTAQSDIPKEPIMNVFKDYKDKGVMPVYASVYYRAICKYKGLKTLVSSDEQREKISKEAEIVYENDLRAKRYHIKDPKNFAICMEQFNKSSATKLSLSFKIALRMYFDSIDELEL